MNNQQPQNQIKSKIKYLLRQSNNNQYGYASQK